MKNTIFERISIIGKFLDNFVLKKKFRFPIFYWNFLSEVLTEKFQRWTSIPGIFPLNTQKSLRIKNALQFPRHSFIFKHNHIVLKYLAMTTKQVYITRSFNLLYTIIWTNKRRHFISMWKITFLRYHYYLLRYSVRLRKLQKENFYKRIIHLRI